MYPFCPGDANRVPNVLPAGGIFAPREVRACEVRQALAKKKKERGTAQILPESGIIGHEAPPVNATLWRRARGSISTG
jgi:hypothetical protein